VAEQNPKQNEFLNLKPIKKLPNRKVVFLPGKAQEEGF